MEKTRITMSKDELRDTTSINIQIKVPTYDLYRDPEELVIDLMETVKHHLILQIDNLRGE